MNETLGIVLSNPAFNLVGQGLALLIGDSPLPVLFQIDFVGDKNNRNVVLSTDLKILLTIFSFNLLLFINDLAQFYFAFLSMMYHELKLNSRMFHLYHSGIKLVACTQLLDNYNNSKWYPCRMRHIETIIKSVESLRASQTSNLDFISFKKKTSVGKIVIECKC